MKLKFALLTVVSVFLISIQPASAGLIYLADFNGNVAVWDDQADTLTQVGSLSPDFQVDQTLGLAWDAANGRLLVLDRLDSKVYTMDPGSGTAALLFEPSVRFEGGAVKGNILYGIDEDAQILVAYDLTSFAQVPLAGATTFADHHHGVGIDPATGQLYTSGSSNVYEVADDGSVSGVVFQNSSFAEDIDFYEGNFLLAESSALWQYTPAGVGTQLKNSSELSAAGLSSLSGVVVAADGQGEVPSNASFNVTKTFSDQSTDPVEVTLTCNGGLPLSQSFTIEGGDPDGVTFTVTNLPDGGASCSVTETGGPDGYDVTMTGGDNCTWTGVENGSYSCVVENVAKDGSYTVNVAWDLFETTDATVDTSATVTITCNSEIVPGTQVGGSDDWSYETTLTGDGQVTVAVDLSTATPADPATCSATQSVSQSGVETSGSCPVVTIGAAEEASCTYTNTLFFEGIPTLSQYGLMIMALLMGLGGMLGFRRYV